MAMGKRNWVLDTREWTFEKFHELNKHEQNIFNFKSNMGPIIWPGDSTSVPKGWEIPTNEKKLRVGVPVKIGSPEFVKVVRDPSTNKTLVSGYCIDIFNAVMEKLPYAVTYDFIPFAKPDGTSAGTYNQLVDQVYLGVKSFQPHLIFSRLKFEMETTRFDS
ncbi:glutamate receptor 2.7 [Prunus dulcis]|uniref:Glutamate receptor 2.7 n=1 Tax=Prunus dulcis TaxID=3755 RepID=A0A5H2Y765_PRUDU|nr:glutamate receptor 2.7 [Prunus dulcis]